MGTRSPCILCGRTRFKKGTVTFNTIDSEYCVCYDCIKELHEKYHVTADEFMNADAEISDIAYSKPSKIKEYLDTYIIGQDKAKKVISTAIYNHYKILDLKRDDKKQSSDIDKSNILIIGPTASGKTAMLSRIAKILRIPFTIVDATSITEAGFVGADCEVAIRNLISAANGNVDLAQRGIVYFDEIDKIARKGENMSVTTDPGHEGVQQVMLKLIEGSIVDVPEKGMRKHPDAPVVKVDTTDILFIAGGSFEHIEKIIAKRQRQNISQLGFGAIHEIKSENRFNDLIHDVRVEDLRTFGLLPEFLERFHILCTMDELDEDDYVKILTEPRDALTKQYKILFEKDGVELDFTEQSLRFIAHQAIERKTGARSLRGIMENILGDLMYEIPDNNSINSVVVDVEDSAIITRKGLIT